MQPCSVNLYSWLMPDLRTRQEVAGCSHRGAVVGVVWTQCGRYLLSLGSDNTIRRWDSNTGRNLRTNFPRLASVGKHPVDLVVSSGGDRDSLFVGEKAAVRVFDIETGREGRSMSCCSLQRERWTTKRLRVWLLLPATLGTPLLSPL